MLRDGVDYVNRFAITQFDWDTFNRFWPKMERELDLIPHVWRFWTKEFIQAAVEHHALVVWGCGSPPNAEFIFFTQVNIYPAMKILSVPLAFGRFDPRMMDLLDGTMERYARIQECQEIWINGRRGWKPHFMNIGFRHESELWVRPVTQMRIN